MSHPLLPPPGSLPEVQARIAALEKELAQAHEQTEATLRQRDVVLSHLQEGLLLLDAAGNVAVVNEEYCRQLGLALPAARWTGMSALHLAQLGGELTLTSELGRGSTFAFTLTLPKAPVPEPAPADLSAVATYDTGQLAGKRVLLVEDNEINRTVASMIMEPWGVLVEEAVDGPSALVRLSTHRYDVVLMDIQMPGLSGVDVTKRLRQLPDPARAAIPVIALTANAFKTDIDRYLAEGMNDYLAKPFDEEALYHKMVRLLLAAPSPVPLYDLSVLRRQAQGREAFIAQILRSFLANTPASLTALRTAADQHQWPAAATVAHHIQPNLLALGVADVAASLAVLTQAHHANTGPMPAPEIMTAAVHHLYAVVTRVLAVLPAELAAAEALASQG